MTTFAPVRAGKAQKCDPSEPAAANRTPRGPREHRFSAPAPSPLEYFTRLFLEYTVLLEPFFLSTPARRTRGRRIREACGHFRRSLENEIATQRILQDGKRNARYLLRCQRPPSQIWSEAKRFVRSLELKNTSRPLFDWKFEIFIFWSEKLLRKCFESSQWAPETSPNCLRALPGDLPGVHLVL